MLSPSQQLENWLKPLQLEEKQGYSNQSVVKGLDRYLMRQCEEMLKRGGFDFPGSGEFSSFLKQLRSDFSQYMTYSTEERQDLVAKTQTRSWKSHTGNITALAFSSDGQLVAST